MQDQLLCTCDKRNENKWNSGHHFEHIRNLAILWRLKKQVAKGTGEWSFGDDIFFCLM